MTDTDGGIPAKIEETMFEKYATTKATGTGIGLPVARESVVEDGGEMGYENKLGTGATFWIRLPVVVAE